MTTKAFVRSMMELQPRVRSAECVILAHCQTRIFAFPKAHLVSERPLRPAVLTERPGARATVVSDLPDYFRNHTPFRQFRICCSLRSKIDEVLSKRAKNSKPDRSALIVVIEQETPCRTPLDDGTSYIVDEGWVTGGREGNDAVMAWKVDDAPWPDVDETDAKLVKTVLAAVKIVQDETEVIREVAESSCFYDDRDRAVYPMSMTMRANLSVSSPSTEDELLDKLCALRRLIDAFDEERGKDGDRIDSLIDSLWLEKLETDHYRRAWYLSLFEATEAMLSGDRLQQFHQRHRAYRKTIGHPKPDTKVDMNEFSKLQQDSMTQLRTIFLDRSAEAPVRRLPDRTSVPPQPNSSDNGNPAHRLPRNPP